MVEEALFPRPAVAAALKNGFIESRLHNDGPKKDWVREFQIETVNTVATPSYVVIDPESGAELGRYQLSSFPSEGTAGEIIAFLEAAQKSARR